MSDQKKFQTREQKRAEYAWNRVNTLPSGLEQKDFAGLCKQTATRIITSGLGGALAFSLSKKGSDGELHRSLAATLAGHLEPSAKTPEEFLKRLIMGTSSDLRAHTEEAMALLVWLARLAEGKAGQSSNA